MHQLKNAFSTARSLSVVLRDTACARSIFILRRAAETIRFRNARPRFANSLFDGLYARWLRDGDAAVFNARAAVQQPVNACVMRVHNLRFSYGQRAAVPSPANARDG